MSSDHTRNRILAAASQRFFRHGFYRVSMDSLVAEVRTSKSTIYKYFPSKEDLVQAVLEEINREINETLEAIVTDGTRNFQEKLTAVTRFTGSILTKVSEEFLTDLRMHTPELWDVYQSMRQDRLDNLYGRLFRDGIDEGIIRSDMELDFILLVYTKLTELAVQPEALSASPLSNIDAYAGLTTLFLEGALTGRSKTSLNSA
ncbi:TetR/AcrR family transcriptional regulator [bacterium]|nr:TetR/AcrR family transcriptional regulator [bacterium]